ncbi:class I SAM-dependent methyltransferase [Fuscovulum blasticum]|uniref:class I SAM-dependent methyltransferase n=1 Tax=Fuscovulum blasticum TaxID=1075 RepID=UPI000D3E6232|nr:class I SAM-dependent methyltransferase [Fuscovulum blasticum]AWD22575.1 SAM-dependent methyltransferase [Fuscovulum blasticum]
MTTPGQAFWNRIADRYAARPIKDVAAYEEMLAEVGARLRPRDRVLELGCGTGGTAIRLGPQVAEWIATDFSDRMLQIARAKAVPPNVRFVLTEAGTAFDGAPFDAICAFNLLHLVPDMPATLAQVHAALRPGGRLISKTWCFADLRRTLRLLFPLLRVFGLFPPATALSEPQLRQAILAAGFEIETQRSFGRSPQSHFIVARKPGPP